MRGAHRSRLTRERSIVVDRRRAASLVGCAAPTQIATRASTRGRRHRRTSGTSGARGANALEDGHVGKVLRTSGRRLVGDEIVDRGTPLRTRRGSEVEGAGELTSVLSAELRARFSFSAATVTAVRTGVGVNQLAGLRAQSTVFVDDVAVFVDVP